MKLFHSNPVNLATLLSAMAVALIVIITLALSVILYSDYQFNEESLQRSETILSTGLLKGAMPLAVAANDLQLVKSIVHDHLAFEEIYAVEVRTVTGETLYREEKGTRSQVNILPKTYDVVSPYESMEIDSFDGKENVGRKILGSVTIYFSTARIHDRAKQQLYFTASVIGGTILLCFALITIFNRYVSRKLALVLDVMRAIKEGQQIQNRRKPDGVSELIVIDSALRDMANTIYERDDELKITLEEALDAKMVAQKAEEFKDDFIRAISHDIKTPVGVVVNLLELINEDAIAKTTDLDLLEKIAACHQSAKVLLDVTDELFDLEQFQQKTLINKVGETALKDLFDKVASLYQQRFIQKGLMFKVSNRNQQKDDVPEQVLIDESKIILILDNIIDNALKFTSDGLVSLTWKFENDMLLVTIKDSGIGIPEDKLPSIFEKHKQLGDLATNRREGRGLGLYYVKRLIDVMGANMVVSSKPGLGTIFELSIPAQKIDNMPSYPVNLEAQSFDILIIDDDEGTCIALQGKLKKMGFDSSFECIPEIGFSRLIKEKPDLVFIDYHMPNTSGDQIAINAQKLLPATSFYVCITAEASEAKLHELEGIFQVVLRKPFNTEGIRNIIERVMHSKTIASKILSNIADNS